MRRARRCGSSSTARLRERTPRSGRHLAGRCGGGRHRSAPTASVTGTGRPRPRAPLGLGHQGPDRAGRLGGGRGGHDQLGRTCRAAGVHHRSPAGPRLGAGLRPRRSARPAGHPAHLLEPGHRARCRPRRRQRRHDVRRLPHVGGPRTARPATARPWRGRRRPGREGCLDDLVLLAGELLRPTLVSADTLAAATSVAFPGRAGILPGFGRQTPNDWGLGVELKDHKSPHWTATTGSPRTFGHFGQSGCFLWVDPVADLACCCLTDRPFGPWAASAWPGARRRQPGGAGRRRLKPAKGEEAVSRRRCARA